MGWWESLLCCEFWLKKCIVCMCAMCDWPWFSPLFEQQTIFQRIVYLAFFLSQKREFSVYLKLLKVMSNSVHNENKTCQLKYCMNFDNTYLGRGFVLYFDLQVQVNYYAKCSWCIAHLHQYTTSDSACWYCCWKCCWYLYMQLEPVGLHNSAFFKYVL